jgi:hypothetical protein
MSAIENFCSNIVRDIKMVTSEQPEHPEIRDIRIANLALRVFGLIIGAVALSCFFGALGTAIISPASAVTSLICSVFLFTLAHDMVIVGHNRSEITNSLSGFGSALWNSFWGLTPRDFQNTWVAGSIYNAVQSA